MILFLKFKQKGKLLFLQDDGIQENIDPKQKYYIVLSPSLYWVKRVTLPLKYVHEVKKIAATLFEELLPSGNYNFYVVKQAENDFFVFAYEDNKILSLLTQKGIAVHQLSGITFAQFAFEDLSDVIEVNSENVISKKDDTVVLLPTQWFHQKRALQAEDMKISKHTIHLEQFSHIVDRKTLYKIVTLLLLFILVLFGEYFYFVKQKEALFAANEKLFKEYNLKPTLMQNRAILDHYKKQDLQEAQLRKYIDYFLKANLDKKEKILSMEYKERRLRVVIQGLAIADAKRALAMFYKDKIKLNIKQKKGKLIVEVSI